MNYKPYYPELDTFQTDTRFRRDAEFAIRNLDNVNYSHLVTRRPGSIVFKTSHMNVGFVESFQYENTWLVFPIRY